ncbi:dynein regulatory complex subunit 7-like [Saccoglossus kowalevskii]|uniref:Dynein regulatory complex subunit 7 n=1 Tax=Saccoglossus kowalevskii TaxID=10224 RepID=A0ABM0H0A4_SACKO|nr:PREDICTED: coiled-coil domain-containing protein lobo homolog [Saccoglossus kowalevskii]
MSEENHTPVEDGLLEETKEDSSESKSTADVDQTPTIEEETEAELEESEDVQAMREELDKIKIEPPKIDLPVFENLDAYPLSYKENDNKETLVLQYAENFRRQFVHLYRDRKPLLLNPLNECGVEKFVCTTIRPTLLPYQEMYDYDGAAEFVADYITFVPLAPPIELPKTLFSPATVLAKQKGHCLEMSTLLCSLLLGAGYDAYVVSGYATKEMCLCDETREICPLMQKKKEVKKEEETKESKKYTVKPAKDLRSKFIMKQEQRKIEEQEKEREKIRKEEEEKQAELEKPPPDDLFGLRIHSWVLVLSGKREVPENFFIEPLSGGSFPTDDDNFLGIESLWNNTNYWVCMQDCSNGCKDLIFDLGDCSKWEYMFPHIEKPQLQIPEVEEDALDFDDDEDEEKEEEKHLDLPPSWVKTLCLTLREFQTRCPSGKKTLLYKRAKLEKFAEYLNKNGLVTKLSVYEDKELQQLVRIKEWYSNRLDKLQLRVHNHRKGIVTEYYASGRSRHLKEHIYKAVTPGPESERTMIFYHHARVDGLKKRDETATEMTEYFVDRDDFLYYRHVVFGKRPRKLEPAGSNPNSNPRPILKIVDRFHRNKAKPANDDVAELIFMMSEDRIQLMFHHEDTKISASTREFLKPPNANDKGSVLTMSPDMTSTFQVDPNSKQPKDLIIYQMLVNLLEREEATVNMVRDSEEEVREILSDRDHEESVSELSISVYDTERNEKAKQHRKELERLQMEEKMRREEMELDYLAPFLAQIGDPEKIVKAQAFTLKEDCLADLKHRLIDKANLIQARFEKETTELQKKQQWYQQHQVSMNKEDEEEYLNYCSEAMFRIHILELRLNRHKETAPHKYMALEQKLRTDSRLAEYF